MKYKLLLSLTLLFVFETIIKAQNINNKTEQFQKILNKACDNKKVFGTTFCLASEQGTWCGAAGDMKIQQPFFIASTTKLFISALFMQQESKGNLRLDDPIAKWLGDEIIQGLHVYKGIEYSRKITLKQLLAHTSGLPDYFEDKGANGSSLLQKLCEGNDQHWTPLQAIAMSKNMQPLFAPGTPGKAHYSDTNYQLLGLILEQLYQKKLEALLRDEIFTPLQMTHTYLYTDSTDTTPQLFYYKKKPLKIPAAMTSFGADGGIVSTVEDLQIFLHAFFGGLLFPKEKLTAMKSWNPIFSPLESGIGIHRFKLPAYMNPGHKIPDLMGHSGLSGTFAYYSERDGLYITGTANQVAYPQTSFVTAIKLIQVYLRK